MRKIASIALSIAALAAFVPDAGAQSQASSQADAQAGTIAGFQAGTTAASQAGLLPSSFNGGSMADTQAGTIPDSQAGTMIGNYVPDDRPVQTGPLWGLNNMPSVITNGGGYGGFSLTQDVNPQTRYGMVNGFAVPGMQSPALRGLQSPVSAMNRNGGQRQKMTQKTVSSAVQIADQRNSQNRNLRLRGGVSTTQAAANDMSLMRGPNGPILTGAFGEQSTLVPSDFFLFTGALGPADGGVTYTQDYLSQIRARMSGRQFYGPMSVVRMNHGSLKPQVMATQDVLVEGIPQRVSGTVIMETPDARAIERRLAGRANRTQTAGRAVRPVY